MDLIDKEITLNKIDYIMNCIYIVIHTSNLYEIKEICMFDINDNTDLLSLIKIPEENYELNIFIMQFLEFANLKLNEIEKQYIYLHYFLGYNNSEIKIGIYNQTYNCVYQIQNAYRLEKNIKERLMYVFSENVVSYKGE